MTPKMACWTETSRILYKVEELELEESSSCTSY
jgi:hypothetical protein